MIIIKYTDVNYAQRPLYAAYGAEDHEDAVISVKEMLVKDKQYWEGPILAVITGGKK